MAGAVPSGTARRMLGALLFVPVVGIFAFSQSAAQWMLVLIAAAMVWEFASMVRLAMPLRLAMLMDFTLFALPAPLFLHLERVAGMSLFPVVLALAGLVVLLVWVATRKAQAALFLAVMICCIVAARGILGIENGHWLMLGLAAVIASCDVAAYFTGRRIGGPRLAPRISPNKTRSGAVGGLLGAMMAGVLLMPVLQLSLFETMAGATFVAVLAQAGDLFESMFKRQAGVKDSGRLIPGHGGFLDRFDGYLLTMPVVYLYILAV